MIKKFIEWFPPKWSSLGAMLTNNTARAIYAVPAAGFIILYSDYFQTLFKLSVDPTSWGFLTFSTRIKMIYFGSIILLIAFGLFRILAPPLLRNRRDRQHFVSDIIVSRDSSTVHRIIPPTIEYLDRLLPTEKDETKRVRWQALSDLMKRRSTDIGRNAGEFENDIPNILATYYDWQNVRKPNLRSLIFCLTCIGYLLLILPSFDLFLRVLGTSLRDLFAF